MAQLTRATRAFIEPAERRLEVACHRWLLLWALMLMGYTVMGKGFAYLGYPPVFVGDAVLVVGVILAAMALCCRPLFRSIPLAGILVLFWIWGAARTLPYLPAYRFDALRDAALWGYSGYALVLCTLLLIWPQFLRQLVRWYELGWPVMLVGTLAVAILYRVAFADRPTWPHTPDVPILQQKEGDVLVQMAGVTAFWMSGLIRSARWIWVCMLTAIVGTMAALDRAGTLCFLAVLAICSALRPSSRIPWKIAAFAAAFLFLLWLSNAHLEVPGGKGREISFDQLATNALSFVHDTGQDGMDSTKEWRLEWWKEIVGYTISGRYFWQGKGFGVNLADDDGFQVLSTGALRSPHNVHMTILARMGIPGLAIWIVVLGLWSATMVRSYVAARKNRQQRWAGLFLFLGSLFLAMIINATFDVFLEGPMGGIWFWSVLGVGMAAVRLYRQSPEAMDE